MAKKHNVKVTRGTFKLVGKVKGTQSNRFFENKTFDSGATRNKVNFAIMTSETNETYVSVEGFLQKVAKFNKWDNKTRTNATKELPWSDRFDYDEKEFKGFNPMFGTRINLTGDGIATLFQYDACEEIKDGIEDGMSVYVEGSTKFSSYAKDGEVSRYKNLEITKIYKQKNDVDFEADGYKEENMFKQEFVFMAINQELDPETDKSTGRFIVEGKVVTSDGLEDVEFFLEDKKLAGNLKKRLKPYTGITVLGRLITKVEEGEEVEVIEDDGWGEEEDFDNTPNTTKFREMIITKALPDTIDTDSFTEKILATLIQAEEDFGDLSDDDDDSDVDWG